MLDIHSNMLSETEEISEDDLLSGIALINNPDRNWIRKAEQIQLMSLD